MPQKTPLLFSEKYYVFINVIGGHYLWNVKFLYSKKETDCADTLLLSSACDAPGKNVNAFHASFD